MKKYLYLTGIIVVGVVVLGFFLSDNSLISPPAGVGAGEGSEEGGGVENTNLAPPLAGPSEQSPVGEAPRPIDKMDKLIEEGIALKSKGDFAGAAETWKQASLANPDSYVPHNNLGFLYRYDLKDPVLAEKSFLDAIAIKADFISAYRELSDLYRYAYPEKKDQADDILFTGLEKNSGNYDLLVYLAAYYRDMGDKQNSKKYFEQALASDPSNEAVIRELKNL